MFAAFLALDGHYTYPPGTDRNPISCHTTYAQHKVTPKTDKDYSNYTPIYDAVMAADTTGRALDALRQLDEYARRREVEHLIDTQVLELNGFTLYKYHILPQICNETRGSNSLPVHNAQV